MLNIIVILLVLSGILLSLFNLPGIWFVWGAFVLHSISTGFTVFTSTQLIVLGIISLVISLLDNFITPLGASRFGSTKWGIIGAILGGIGGVLLAGPVGMIVGPFLGATLLEVVIAKKDIAKASRAGFGAFLGFMVSVILKFGGVVAVSLWGLFQIY